MGNRKFAPFPIITTYAAYLTVCGFESHSLLIRQLKLRVTQH